MFWKSRKLKSYFIVTMILICCTVIGIFSYCFPDKYIGICSTCGMIGNVTAYYVPPFSSKFSFQIEKIDDLRSSYFNTFVGLKPCKNDHGSFLPIKYWGRTNIWGPPPITAPRFPECPMPVLIWDFTYPELESELTPFLKNYEKTHPDLKEQLLRVLKDGNVIDDQQRACGRTLYKAWEDWRVAHKLIPQEDIDLYFSIDEEEKKHLKEIMESTRAPDALYKQ